MFPPVCPNITLKNFACVGLLNPLRTGAIGTIFVWDPTLGRIFVQDPILKVRPHKPPKVGGEVYTSPPTWVFELRSRDLTSSS